MLMVMRFEARRLMGALALLCAIALPGSALAVPFSFDTDLGTPGLQGITGFVAGTATVNILPVQPGDIGGLPASILLDGTVIDFNSQDWLLFQVEVTAGSVTSIGGSSVGESAVGVGYYADPDVTPTSGSTAGEEWFFVTIGAGSKSDRLFSTFSLGDLPGDGFPPAIDPGSSSFMINDGMNIFSITDGTIVPIPEPSTFFLIGLGLLGLTVSTRRRR